MTINTNIGDFTVTQKKRIVDLQLAKKGATVLLFNKCRPNAD